jgi:hypothetical protein
VLDKELFFVEEDVESFVKTVLDDICLPGFAFWLAG